MSRKDGKRNWFRNMSNGPLNYNCVECYGEIPKLGDFVILHYKCYDEILKEIEELKKKVERSENGKDKHKS